MWWQDALRQVLRHRGPPGSRIDRGAGSTLRPRVPHAGKEKRMTLSGKMAVIDLSARTVEIVDIPRELRETYLGGRGINMYLLHKYVQPQTDPLGPDNPLIFGVGLLTGTLGWGMARGNVSGRSPESGYLGDSNIGGDFCAELKFAGYDHLLIKGKSPTPVFLWIHDDKIEIRDAGSLWGLDTAQTQDRIRKELGNDYVKTACIGPAGEKLVRFACVISGPKNAAGKTGMGALMGSKKLKAIAVRGIRDLEIAYPQEYVAHVDEIMGRLAESRWAQALGRLGTPMMFSGGNALGTIGVRNPPMSSIGERGEALNGEHVLRYSIGMSACVGCTVHCRHRHRIAEGKYTGTQGEGPENGSVARPGA